MSLLVVGGSVVGMKRRSTFNDKDLDEMADISGHGTGVDEDLSEIAHDLVETRSPLQTMPKVHKLRMTSSQALC